MLLALRPPPRRQGKISNAPASPASSRPLLSPAQQPPPKKKSRSESSLHFRTPRKTSPGKLEVNAGAGYRC